MSKRERCRSRRSHQKETAMTRLQAFLRKPLWQAMGGFVRSIYQKVSKQLRGNSRRRYMNG